MMDFNELTGGYWTPKKLANFCVARQDSDLDWTIGITGEKGFGKSSAVIAICKEIVGNKFSMDANVILVPDAQKITEIIDASGPRPALILDEAIATLYCENWASKEQKGFHIFLNMFQRRDKHCILFLCIPYLQDLRGPLVRSSMNMWIHLYRRGEGVIFIRSSAPFLQDPFMRDAMAEQWYYHAKTENRHRVLLQDADFQKTVFASMPTFCAFIKFPQLDTQTYDAYLDHTRKSRVEMKQTLFSGLNDEKIKQKKRQLSVQRLERMLEGSEDK